MATTLEKEGRITFTASEDFIKSVKAYAVSRGKNIKSVMMDCFNLQLQIDNQYINENQADKMLKPLIEKYVNQIQNNTFEGRSLAEIKAECLASK